MNKIFEINPSTGNYIIEISLDKYTDVFNDWDHASFKKRDMDPDLVLFIENCSEDIPLKYGIDICFYLPKEIQDKSREKIITTGFKTYYNFYTHMENKFLKESYKKFLSYIVISFAFLALSYLMANLARNELVYITLAQGVNIGGWVFLWEAISFFFFKKRKIVNDVKTYKRLTGASIYFKYDNLI
ncbi:hypothetical protein ACER0A_002385 [Haloimpatiens sp. FM7315]|uniref:hypothetical protein n=1 Tax=Haloimpatiens sp. FM7315 TaxID=3298609 RepID=UPI0035A32DF7